LDPGPRIDRQIEARLREEVEQERFTSRLPRWPRRRRRPLGRCDRRRLAQTLRAGRLEKVRGLGIAEEIAPSQWRLTGDLEPVLRRMGEQGHIVKTLNRAMTGEGLSRGAAASGRAGCTRLVGRVIIRGLSDEMTKPHHLLLDAVDSRTHYADIGKGDAVELLPEGAIVSIEPKRTLISCTIRRRAPASSRPICAALTLCAAWDLGRRCS
jgi:type IV secretory pathway VirD2 relaxase